MTYVLLIYRTAPPSERISDEAVKSALAGHRAVQAEAHGRGELHAVAQLGEPHRAITVRRGPTAHEVTDGPYVETKEWLGGFALVEVPDDETAKMWAGKVAEACGWPHEVRKFKPQPPPPAR